MNFLHKLVKSQNFWPLIIVVVFGVMAGRSLIFEKGYFNMHDDLQMMRQLEMEKCFLDWQIPCRWIPDMGYGYGFPLFNFYPPLPYLVGQVFRLMQFSFVETVKLTFALAFIASGITMYFLSKEFFGRWGGAVSAIFYIWAPYHSVDIYVRGAMNEAWALVWFPLILLTSYRLIRENKQMFGWGIGLSLSWAALLLSHNIMAMIFIPVFAGWSFLWWLKNKNLKIIFQLLLAGVYALGLTSFFTLPAVFEQKYVHVDTLIQGYYEYIAHFAAIGQLLFSRYWGYGASIWGPRDAMPFQIGYVHWILSLMILVRVMLGFIKKKLSFRNESLLVVLFSIVFGWFAAFMVHQNSTPLWQHIKPLAFVQFPWRFLTLVILGFSIASGYIVVLIRNPVLKVIIPAGLIILLLITNWNYFQPKSGKMGPLTDSQKFSGIAWNMQRTAGIFDYLPKTAKQNPKDPQGALAVVVDGNGIINDSYQGTDWAKFRVNGISESTIRVNIFEFPNWKIQIDGKAVKSYIPSDEVYGRMYLTIPRGEHFVSFKLANTPIRIIANSVSLAAWLVLLSFPFWKKRVAHYA